MRSKIIFISDVHLRGLYDVREKAFLRFLREHKASLSRLVIVGDLFDFWIGYPTVVYTHYFPVLYFLYELREEGVEIDYIEGNHDFHLGPFFKDVLKCNIYSNEVLFHIDKYRICVCHGDLVNKKDKGNRIMRFFLRSSFIKGVVKFVPPHWLWKIGHSASRLSHFYNRRDPKSKKIEALYAHIAENQLKLSDNDVFIVGHSHTPDERVFTFGDKQKYYFNIGDWVTHFTYVEYDSRAPTKKFSLKQFIFDTHN